MYKRLAGQRREAFPLPASSAYLPEWPAAAPDRGVLGPHKPRLRLLLESSEDFQEPENPHQSCQVQP